MHHHRRAAALAGLFLAPALVACGNDSKPDPSEWGTAVGTPGATADATTGSGSGPRSDATPTAGADLAARTVAQDGLSAEQLDLYEDVLLFEESARAKAGDGFGGSSGSFSDVASDDIALPRPEGLQVARRYQISWAEGELIEYELETEAGEKLRWSDGTVYLDFAVGSPEDTALVEDGAALTRAIDAWVAQHDDFPSISSSFDDYVLAVGMLDDYEAEDVTLPVSDSVAYGGHWASGDEFEVAISSDETQESATVTQDGVLYFMPLEVVES